MKVEGLHDTQYILSPTPFKSGGEGSIHDVISGSVNQVAKVYFPGVVSQELEEKLIYMVKNPPGQSVLTQVAWPLDVICNNRQFYGFVMPKLNINAELGELYRYPSTSNISSKQKMIIAGNICVVISAVHDAGYVFGDFNPRNIGVDSKTSLVAFLDTDTYHVSDVSINKTYRCNVCAPGYSAPELLEKCSNHVSANPSDSKNVYSKTSLPTFTEDTDNFALAIHIFKLLMNGFTPYGGITETDNASQASPGVGDAAVRRDNYCFKPGNKPQSAAVPPLDTLPQEIADLFTRAFIVGKFNPNQRPTAMEWHSALLAYEGELVTCRKNNTHHYHSKNSSCPLCEADLRYNVAIGTQAPATQSNTAQPSITQRTYTPVQPPTQPQQALPLPMSLPPRNTISSNPSGGYQSSAQRSWWQKNRYKSIIAVVVLAFIFLGYSVLNSDTSNGLGNNAVSPHSSNAELITQEVNTTQQVQPIPAPAAQTPYVPGQDIHANNVQQVFSDGFILPFSSERVLTSSDLHGLTSAELRIARNEIFARHGRRFRDTELQAHFDSQSWYVPTLPLGTEPTLTSLEISNAEFIQAHETQSESVTTGTITVGGGFLLPFSNTRALTDNDLQNLSSEELRIARNEIYARHGRRFRDEALQAHFDAQSWYVATLPLGTEPSLSALEILNAEFIQSHEERR